MSKALASLVAAILHVMAGCSDETRTDVSQQREYKDIVGAQYEVVGSVDAYGIRPHSRAPVEYVTLIPAPGVEGPEVGFRVPLLTGSKLTIQRVVKTNRMFDRDISYEVRLEGTQMPVDVPIRLDLFRGNEGKEHLQLNPALYRTTR